MQREINDFRDTLYNSLSLSTVNGIVDCIVKSPELFDDIYQLTYDGEKKVAWRAVWVCEKLSLIMPSLLSDKREEIKNMIYSTNHDGMKRLYLNILLNLPEPDSIDIQLLDFCLDRMFSLNETSGCQAVYMKLAFKICQNEKELLNELEIYLENMETSFYKAAAISTRKNTLKKIRKLKSKNIQL